MANVYESDINWLSQRFQHTDVTVGEGYYSCHILTDKVVVFDSCNLARIIQSLNLGLRIVRWISDIDGLAHLRSFVTNVEALFLLLEIAS